MKIIQNIVVLAFWGLTSCSGFLDEMDQDKFVPTKVDHYASMLLGEFNNGTTVFSGVQYMTDEVQESEGKIDILNGRVNAKPMYTWQKDIEQTEAGKRVGNNVAWGGMYKEIALTNYVIELVDKAEGNQSEIDYTKGEAYFIRAYRYFCLTNLYAEPYQSEEQAKVTYGVPLRTGIGTNQTYDKNMLSKSYQLIEDDLKEARLLIERSGLTKSVYHPTVLACDLLLSRVKLYKKEYAQAIEAASRVITKTSLRKLTEGSMTSVFIVRENPELLYSFSQSTGGLTATQLKDASLVVSRGLLDMYDEADLRKQLFFQAETDEVTGAVSIYPRKMERGYSQLGFCNFRTAEAYLNRAEAYAFTNRLDEARNDMYELLSKRYADITAINIPADQSALIRFIFNERFKELCFETHHRWFDLRRMEESLRPEIVHQFSVMDGGRNKIGTETYHLLRNDRNYTLSVPMLEKQNNPLIRDYERFDKLADYDEEIIF